MVYSGRNSSGGSNSGRSSFSIYAPLSLTASLSIFTYHLFFWPVTFSTILPPRAPSPLSLTSSTIRPLPTNLMLHYPISSILLQSLQFFFNLFNSSTPCPFTALSQAPLFVHYPRALCCTTLSLHRVVSVSEWPNSHLGTEKCIAVCFALCISPPPLHTEH